MKNIALLLLFIALFAIGLNAQEEQKKPKLDIAKLKKVPEKELDPEKEPEKKPEKELLPVNAVKRSEARNETEVSVDYSRQWLTNGRGTWDEARIGVVHKFTKRQVVFGSYSETKRFGLRDRTGTLGIYQPLSKKWTLVAEAAASPTHKVLPKWSAMVQIERSLGNGWIAHAGFRRIQNNTAKVNITKLGFEKYWGHNRLAGSTSVINLENTGTSGSARVHYSRYYGNGLSSIGIGIAAGREVENIGPNTVLQSDIYNISVNGKHAFSRRWALGYGYTHHRQGAVYTRRGVTVGLRYKF